MTISIGIASPRHGENISSIEKFMNFFHIGKIVVESVLVIPLGWSCKKMCSINKFAIFVEFYVIGGPLLIKTNTVTIF